MVIELRWDGDKTGINDQSMNNIQMIGISHLFVVSGLHVGMITSALNFLINKTKKEALK